MTKTTALLVIDMQHIFHDMTTSSLPHVLRLCDHFLASNRPLIFTQHGHSKQELTPPLTNQLVRKWGIDGSIATGSPEWEFLPEIKKRVEQLKKKKKKKKSNQGGERDEEEVVVKKNTYDAFVNTTLEAELQRANVGRVVVCGVMTDCCCDTTARGAFNRGFETWLVGDACGSASKRQHEAGLRGFGFACGGGCEEVG